MIIDEVSPFWKTLLLKLGQRKAFLRPSLIKFGLPKIKCDTGRFKCVCDRYKQIESIAKVKTKALLSIFMLILNYIILKCSRVSFIALNLCLGHLGGQYLPEGLLKFSRSIMPHSCLTCAIFNEDALNSFYSFNFTICRLCFSSSNFKVIKV